MTLIQTFKFFAISPPKAAFSPPATELTWEEKHSARIFGHLNQTELQKAWETFIIFFTWAIHDLVVKTLKLHSAYTSKCNHIILLLKQLQTKYPTLTFATKPLIYLTQLLQITPHFILAHTWNWMRPIIMMLCNYLYLIWQVVQPILRLISKYPFSSALALFLSLTAYTLMIINAIAHIAF